MSPTIKVPGRIKGEERRCSTSSLTLSSILLKVSQKFFIMARKEDGAYDPVISPYLVALMVSFSCGANLIRASLTLASWKCVIPQSVSSVNNYTSFNGQLLVVVCSPV